MTVGNWACIKFRYLANNNPVAYVMVSAETVHRCDLEGCYTDMTCTYLLVQSKQEDSGEYSSFFSFFSGIS